MTMEYEAQGVWYGYIYKGELIKGKGKSKSDLTKGYKKRDEKKKRFIDISNKYLDKIAKKVNGKFLPHSDMQTTKVIGAGTQIVFPPLRFERTFNPSPINFECKVTLNPLIEREELYGKIWTAIGATSNQSSGKARKFFDEYVIEPRGNVENEIKQIVVQAEDNLNLNDIKYPITMRNLGSNKISSDHEVFELFETNNKSKAKSFLRNEEVKTIIKDILYLLEEDDTSDPTLDRMQDMDIHWEHMKCFDSSGEHRFVYGIKAEDDDCKVAGFTNFGNHKDMYDFFQHTVLEFTNVL